MKFRVAMLALLLVVLPTLILTFVATHALRNWELALQQRLQRDAAAAIRQTSKTVTDLAESALASIHHTLQDVLARGGRGNDFEQATRDLRESAPWVAESFIYLNPWGLVWPEKPAGRPDPATAAPPDEHQGLVDALRLSAAAHAAPAILRLRVDDEAYLFRATDTTEQLYVGYRVDPEALRRTLDDLLGRTTGQFCLTAVGPDFRLGGNAKARNAAVMVEDPFGPGQELAPYPEADLVYERRLPAPFQHILLQAHLVDADDIRRAAGIRAQLYAVGLAVMGAGMLTGLGLLFWLAAREIRRARQRSAFMLGVSHDLRTPLSSMRTLTETLCLGHVRDEAQRQQFLENILRECDRMAQLVERVLYLVRFGQGNLTFGHGEFDAAALAQQAAKTFGALFAAGTRKGRAATPVIELEAASDLPPARGDAGALLQVLTNLLDNAWMYGRRAQPPEGVPDIRVRVTLVERSRAWRKRRWICFSVIDQGAGMHPRDLRRAFRPFFRSATARHLNVSGIGLGLAIARRIVEAHGGWMEAVSHPGKGSTFSVFLPATETEC